MSLDNDGGPDLCPSCGVDLAGWSGGDCGRQARDNNAGGAAATWRRHPATKRLRRLLPASSARPDASAPPDDDPWAGLVQLHWGGDWAALTPPLGKGATTGTAATTAAGPTAGTTTAAEKASTANPAAAPTCTTPATPSRGSDDPWEPHPWASRVQPTWGGPWA